MLESAWLFVGAIATLWTVIAVVAMVVFPPQEDTVTIVAGVAGFVSWGVWTFGSLNVSVVGDAVTYTFSMPSVTLLGISLALIPAYAALAGPFDMVLSARPGETRVDKF